MSLCRLAIHSKGPWILAGRRDRERERRGVTEEELLGEGGDMQDLIESCSQEREVGLGHGTRSLPPSLCVAIACSCIMFFVVALFLRSHSFDTLD